MPNTIIYDPDNIAVPNRVTCYFSCQSTANPNSLIDPDLSLVSGVEQKYWKVSSDTVVPMTVEERGALEEYFKSKNIPERNFKILTYSSNNVLLKETWYETDAGDGSYSTIAEESIYNYTGSSLISILKSVYCYDGSVDSTEHINYFKDGNKYIEKYIGG